MESYKKNFALDVINVYLFANVVLLSKKLQYFLLDKVDKLSISIKYFLATVNVLKQLSLHGNFQCTINICNFKSLINEAGKKFIIDSTHKIFQAGFIILFLLIKCLVTFIEPIITSFLTCCSRLEFSRMFLNQRLSHICSIG